MNHEELYKKIREAQPNKKWGYVDKIERCSSCNHPVYSNKIEPIQLNDVMIALMSSINGNGYEYAITTGEQILELKRVDEVGLMEYEGTIAYWDFGKPLSGQSDKLKNWLKGVLK